MQNLDHTFSPIIEKSNNSLIRNLPTTMSSPILQIPQSTLSFSTQIIPDPTHKFLKSSFSNLSITKLPPSTTIRMGGGPRTYPGGVSKWQWKRMQLKKSKQLLKARLARERQIYEMRKRAELNAAVSELERPWEIVETAPKLFSTTADEQLKVLADRFQKPGGFDLWCEKDGPQLFEFVDGIPSNRFFPKGVVHSIKPYGKIRDSNRESELVQKQLPGGNSGEIEQIDMGNKGQFRNQDSGLGQRNGQEENSSEIEQIGMGIKYRFTNQDSGLGQRNGDNENSRNSNGEFMELGSDSGLGQINGDYMNSRNSNGKFMKSGSGQRNGDFEKSRNSNRKFMKSGSGSGGEGLNLRENGRNWRKNSKRGNGRKDTKVFDMNLQDDGSYGISKKEIK